MAFFFPLKNQAMEVVLPGGALIFNIGIRHALVGVSVSDMI